MLILSLLFAFTISLSNVYCESLFKAYIINLAHRPNRLENIKHQLEKYSIPYSPFSAISPAEIETERVLRLEGRTSGRFDPETKMVFRVRPRGGGKNILATQIGCTQSHLQILLKETRTNSSAPFLILEDDAVLQSNFYVRSIDLMNRIKSPWDILHVGHCYISRAQCDVSGETGPDYCKAKKQIISCTQGYFVNGSEAAKKIVSGINTEEPGIYDYLLRYSTDNYFISLPELVGINHSFASDNNVNSKQD